MKILNVNMKVVAFSFLFATTFWFFRAMSSSHSANIDFPVLIEYDQESLVRRQGYDKEIIVNVSGSGWSLLWAEIGGGEIDINLRYADLSNKDFLLGPQLLPILSDQVENLKLNYVYSDTMRFYFANKISKEIKFVPESIVLDDQHYLNDNVIFKPSSITISGPDELLSNYSNELKVSVENFPIDEKKNSLSLDDFFTDEITLNTDKVKIEYEVLEFKKEELILTFQIQPKSDSGVVFSQQLSFECMINKTYPKEELKKVIVSNLSLDSVNVGSKAIIPVMGQLPAEVHSLVIRPSKIFLDGHSD